MKMTPTRVLATLEHGHETAMEQARRTLEPRCTIGGARPASAVSRGVALASPAGRRRVVPLAAAGRHTETRSRTRHSRIVPSGRRPGGASHVCTPARLDVSQNVSLSRSCSCALAFHLRAMEGRRVAHALSSSRRSRARSDWVCVALSDSDRRRSRISYTDRPLRPRIVWRK